MDVVGPITLPQTMAYYGASAEGSSTDAHFDQFCKDAIAAVDGDVDFNLYDNDGDGNAELVCVIYAGYGQNISGNHKDTIWPKCGRKNVTTSDDYTKDTCKKVVVSYINCGAELLHVSKGNEINGFGTFIHEFSHGLGLADHYATVSTARIDNQTPEYWDLMDYGEHAGNGYAPVPYSVWEQEVMGWTTVEVLSETQNVNGMKPLSQDGNAYILYNDGYPDEFYLLENRQQTGWDEQLPSTGLLILHVDYDETVWYYNMVNTVADFQEKPYYGPGAINDHERCNMFHANNSSYNSLYTPYPYLSNNSLTRDSSPAATLYHPNSKGELFMDIGITDITQNDDGTIAFRTVSTTSNLSPIRPQEEGTWYTLDGRRLTNRPEGKGIFIYNGKKIIK
jgi:M6 family metalloprotease-like protein